MHHVISLHLQLVVYYISLGGDITFAVSNVACFCSRPTAEHWTAVKRIFRYLKGTSQFNLLYVKGKNEILSAYSDTDWAGDVNDRKSTSGYIFVLSGGAVSWKSRKQTCVALSTAESEYVALANTRQEVIWMRQLMEDLQSQQNDPTIVFENNQAAICIAQNPQHHAKTKHIDIKYHFVWKKVLDHTIQLKYCPTNEMVADLLTKRLSHEKLVRLRDMSGSKEMSAFK